MENVREYVFVHGNKPSRAEGSYPSYGATGTTTRTVYKNDDGFWVVRWEFVPTPK